MGHRKKLRFLLGIFKDKTSLIKTTLFTKRYTSSIHRKILYATPHGASAPPSDKRVATVLSLGQGTRSTACACIEALMERLHGTRNATVALKCLFIVHKIITKGSFILKDQLSFYPSSGGRNFLNLSTFRDDLDLETWELSSWVRWYAVVLEQNLMVSRALGYYLCRKNDKDNDGKILVLLNSDLLGEIDGLVGFVEELCGAPDSLDLQKNSLVYEVVRLVGEDYRLVQREILVRVVELGDRMESLSLGELTQLVSGLQRLEDCKEKLVLLFVNRKRNDGLWDLIGQTKMKLVAMMKEKREEKRLAIIGKRDGDQSSELTRFGERFAEAGPASCNCFYSWIKL